MGRVIRSVYPRQHAAVGCSHCQRLRATRSCPACGRPVCPACEPLWGSCPEPKDGGLELGRGRLALDVDADGRALLVAEPGLALRRIDLEGVPLELPRHCLPTLLPPVLGAGGALVRARCHPITGELEALVVDPLPGHGRERTVLHAAPAGVPRRLLVSREGSLALVQLRHDLVLVAALDARGAPLALRLPAPCSALAGSAKDRLLAAAIEDAVQLVELHGRAGVRRVVAAGEVDWVGLAPQRLALRDRQGLLIHELDGGGEQRLGWAPLGPLSLSPEGRWLAAADGREVHLWELGRSTSRLLGRLPGSVELLRFSLGGRLLLAADRGGVLRLWPRTAQGFVPRACALPS